MSNQRRRNGWHALWVVIALGLGGSRAAQAQIVKPNILIIFDTSGSMEESSPGTSTGADGTNSCGGSGSNSRLALLKAGIRSALAQVGEDEVNFGLMSFPTLVNPGATPACYSCCGVNNPGSTYAGHYYISNPSGSNGCTMTTHYDAGLPTSYSASWFDSGLSQTLRVDLTKVSPGTKPSASDFDPTDGNVAKVYKWIDNHEDGGAVSGSLSDPELHAMGATPLGRELFYARLYFENFILPADPKSCRHNLIILVTDGNETCGSDPNSEAATLHGTDGIPVYVITDTATGAANDTIASNGGTGSATRITLTDSAAVASTIMSIIAKSVPPGESCNCADDNCNGQIDEAFPLKGTACSVGTGACKRDGVYGCNSTGGGVVCIDGAASACGSPALTPGPSSGEVCNGIDDDCNGLIDDGIPGGCTCAKTLEICDGKDNNCNGQTDEGSLPGVGTPCGSSKGECKPGAVTCTGGKLVCTGGKGPGVETCNGKDDNCNGVTDESDPALGQSCYPAMTLGCDVMAGTCKGLCRLGAKVCEGAKLVCKFAQTPVPEQCNGLDDDCDGVIDNGFDVGGACDNGKIGACKRTGTWVCAPGGGRVCTAPPGTGASETCNGMDDDCNGMTDEGTLPGVGLPCGVSVGECTTGTTVCEMGKLVCKGGKMGGTEVCNGKDDNCNGLVDEGVPGVGEDCVCPGLDPALIGVGECKGGKTVCQGAMGIVCQGCTGPTMEICDLKDNDCDGVTDNKAPCPNGFACRGGECAPECKSGEFPCPAGQKCDMGYCVPEPCAGIDCGDHACKDGKCIDPCADKMCPAKTTCDEGNCVSCYTQGYECPGGQRCIDSTCTVDPCEGVNCGVGEFCNDGVCLSTCDNVQCGAGTRCIAGVCHADACVGVACGSNEYCDPATGECKANPCAVTQCMPGLRCIPATGKCEADPCDVVVCNRDCLHCDVTPDGQPDCIGPPSCRTNRSDLASGGGGGCSCALGAGDATENGGRHAPGPAGAAAILLAALMVLRPRSKP